MGCGTSQESIKAVSLPSNERYDRRELIGVGHHGRVYKCFYELDKKQYANKVVDQFRPNTNLQKVQADYWPLINRLKKLRNDKITPYYQVDFTEKEVSIVMEISREGTLKKHIQKNGAQSEETASNLAESILMGLDYLHNAGVIHKDLKSTNVLMMPRNEIKLSDYGIAEIYDERLSEKQGKGYTKSQIDNYREDSLPYMAPEVVKSIEVIDKSDVWSVGCILIEVLTGQVPWTDLGDNFQKAFKIISNGAIPPLPKGISKECSSFLEGCLAVIPTQRASVKDLLGHKFIRKYSKNSSLFFEETSLDNIKVTLENSDKVNRMQQRPQKNAKLNSYLHQPIDLKKEVAEKEMAFGVPRDRESRVSRRDRISRQIDQNMVKIKQALNSIQPKGKQSPLELERPKPHEQLHTVMLNNKKVQLDPARYKNNLASRRMKTEQNEWSSPPRNKSRVKHSMQAEKLVLESSKEYYDPFKNHSSNFEDSLDAEMKNKIMRLETQPIASEYSDRQYFKRPLKLLKKKLKESKEGSDFSKKLSHQQSRTIIKNQPPAPLFLQEQLEEDLTLSRKIRAITETKREERVIDTELARAERDRFITQQKLMKKLREEEKSKWEEQLKKGAQIIKKQLKYYYYNTNPIVG